jgi:predicted DNA-binding transcriptional regulator YafY
MRADRLLSLLMLLQTRGPLTARELARQLEVTERTVYRDVIALSTSGVPVFSERGPGGGISLLEDYRTNLTGLNPQEVRALFMLSIPSALDQLGVGPELRTALLKLSAALPASRRADQAGARQRIHLDPTGWFETEEQTPQLQTVQAAVWQDRMLEILYISQFGARLEMRVAPYGLVAKANTWNLVCTRDTQQRNLRVLRVAQIKSAALCDEQFQRPEDFDLPGFWKNWCEEFETGRPHYRVRARVSPILANILAENRRETLTSAPPQTQEGWQEVELSFENLEAARTRILGYGGAIEVLEPLALRLSVIDFACQTRARYPNNG